MIVNGRLCRLNLPFGAFGRRRERELVLRAHSHVDPHDLAEFPHLDWKYSQETLEKCAIRASLALDVGCGNGDKTLAHARFAEVFVGGDLDTYALKQALSKRVMVVRFDAHALPFRSGLFDLVTGYHVIEHLHTPSLFVSEVRRVMARGGMAIIITPNRRRINSLVNRMLRILHSKGAVYPMNPDHVHEFDLWELARLAGSFFRGYHVKPIGLKFLVLEVELLPRALRVVGDQLVAICRTPMDQGTI